MSHSVFLGAELACKPFMSLLWFWICILVDSLQTHRFLIESFQGMKSLGLPGSEWFAERAHGRNIVEALHLSLELRPCWGDTS